jgi:hypothetical protein
VTETLVDVPDLRAMLADIGAEQFFAGYWQQQPLAVALKKPDFDSILAAVGTLDIARFCGMAREGARAWLANEFVAHSVIPVDASNAE